MLMLLLMAMTLTVPSYAVAEYEAFGRCLGNERARSGEFPAILDCYTSAYGREDRRLNNVYRAALRRMTAVRRRQVIERQRQWIKDRDARCRDAVIAEGDNDSQDGRLAELSCLIDETQQQSDILLRFR